MAKTLFNIDGEKLRKEFRVRKLDLRAVSLEMGFDDSFLNNCTAPSKNKVNEITKNYLEKVYGIPFESYAVIEEPNEESNNMPATVNVTVDNVTVDPKAIETALINVLMNEEVRKQIVQTIYFAVKRALRNGNQNERP